MTSKQDNAGQKYYEVENARITVIPKTWNGQHGIRIQAYKGTGNSLFRGAEIPIKSKEEAFTLLQAISSSLEELAL